MEDSVVFEEQVSLHPSDFQKEITSINDILLNKLKEKLENKCSRNGFLLQNTLKILSRSMGKASSGRFIGDYVFYVQLQGNVLNPPDGIVIDAEVVSKNKMGIYCNYKNAIRVIIPRDLHIGNENFDSVQVGEKVKVQIKKSRFQVNDDTILSVGYFMENINPVSADDIKKEDDEIVLDE
jgi:DNA-directed RNA polymerase subunit E'/Rpb7